MVPDPRLDHRGNPAFPAHDRRGFPNRETPAAVEIVALGDSMTYGSVGHPEDAWPAALQALTGRTTYNMAIGGWGPFECLEVLAEALEHQPRVVVLGFYLGNDLFDAFRMAYRTAYQAWRGGDRSVEFPAGTWWVVRCAGASAAT